MKKTGKIIEKELIYEIILFAGSVFLITSFYKNNIVTTISLVILWVAALFLWHKKNDIMFFIAAAIAGIGCEIVCVNLGVWKYSNPTLFNLPLWLPFAWGFAGVLIRRIAETFNRV